MNVPSQVVGTSARRAGEIHDPDVVVVNRPHVVRYNSYFWKAFQKIVCVQNAITRFRSTRLRMSNRTPLHFGLFVFQSHVRQVPFVENFRTRKNVQYIALKELHANCKMLTNSTSVPAAQRMCMMRYRLGGLVDHPRAVFSPSA